MKYIFVTISIITLMCACSSTQVKKAVSAPKNTPCAKDNFDSFGQATANGSRYVYNAATKTYEWVSSDENKARMNTAWQYSKEKTVDAYHYLQNKLDK